MDIQTSDFDYTLPDMAIAQEAIEPRDAARLLLVDGLEDRHFAELPSILSSGDLLVVNETKVRSARLMGTRRPGGGRTEVLLTQRVDPERWRALVRPANKLGAGSIVDCGAIEIRLLTEPENGVVTVCVEAAGDVETAIEESGTLPLPPYFHGDLADSSRYQTMFATNLGSSAAPTAALHFTPALITRLRSRDITVVAVNLEVGIDTFRPMSDGYVMDHVIHTERIDVSERAVEAVAQARDRGGKVVAVGTTVVRALESTSRTDGTISAYNGPTDLFIAPGYQPGVVDAMITNFHAPRTTLLVMLAAFMGERWREAYTHALDRGYRFLSFGDAMYLEIDR
ncbi:MAG: tRNA preQ1(34) S-adenosylmethionine ribosyltransferase-isomerase QueA [Actinomycetia bacterium]|nr:tRNA preQ1(34) S-adenosylmethionine ribosyltransferase-isomerase QueA [Actinomycetes bacterium]